MKFHYEHDWDDEPLSSEEKERLYDLYEEACEERAEYERENDYDDDNP
jgi:hypothetical protein